MERVSRSLVAGVPSRRLINLLAVIPSVSYTFVPRVERNRIRFSTVERFFPFFFFFLSLLQRESPPVLVKLRSRTFPSKFFCTFTTQEELSDFPVITALLRDIIYQPTVNQRVDEMQFFFSLSLSFFLNFVICKAE